LGLIASPIAGGDGNREFLIAASSKSEMSLT
jgi:predicted rRNA methylase YqxC with S4 and FtsJ domains